MAALSVLAGLAVQPGPTSLGGDPVDDSYPWYKDTAAEQLRQDQCLMADVLRLGGPSMAATAQDGAEARKKAAAVLRADDAYDQQEFNNGVTVILNRGSADSFPAFRAWYEKAATDVQPGMDAFKKAYG
ncbi:hypothetical protein ACFYZB_39710 [Streptomyces sp. NPDC001852]|uniref:hypothetical protein n=1 Tax=Streptomyces sp. NPDC001852 TaxID=3364619 RepID=UPI00368AF185